MVNISTEQKLDNYRNMCSMISDYDKQYSRWPTSKEFEEKLGMSRNTVTRYKHDILAQDKKQLFDSFNYEIILHTKKAISRLNKNIKDCEEILKKSEDNTEKMDTGQRILDYHIHAIKIMRDVGEYVGDTSNDDVQSEQERIHRKADSENIEDSIESTFN